MSKEKLDEFHYHEMLDRLSIMMDNIDSNLINHPTMEIHQEWKDKVNSTIDILWDIYQEIGKYNLDD